MVAGILPIMAVVILYAVKNIWKRIYISIGLTAAFAIFTKALTNATRVELFMATAA
jgi:hypothetical protein